LWECASMAVLLAATAVEHYFGTICMALLFFGLAALVFVMAAHADLGRPLLSILAFRLTAQLAMTIGTGSILVTTVLHDTPSCSSDVIRSSGWRGPPFSLLRRVLPRAWLRRIFGIRSPISARSRGSFEP